MKSTEARWDPDEASKLDRLIVSAFSEMVRRERRNVLLASVVSLFVTLSGVKAKSASVLGLEFTEVSQPLAYWFLLAITLYFLVAFWLYGTPEFRAAIKQRSEQQEQRLIISANHPLWHIVRQNMASAARYRVWLAYEFALPAVVGIAAIGALSSKLAVGSGT